jgi:predicted secreted protein
LLFFTYYQLSIINYQLINMARELRDEDYLVANGTILSVIGLPVGTSIPAVYTITTTAAAVIAAIVVAVTATTVKLYADTTLKFGTQVVTLTADAAIGATSLAVAPLTAAIASGATASTNALIPVYSVASADTQVGDNIINSRNFLSGLWQTKTVTMRDASIACSGSFVRNDPGFEAIRTAATSRSKLYFELVEPDGTGDKGSAFITNYSRKRQTDQHVEVSFTVNVDGVLSAITV